MSLDDAKAEPSDPAPQSQDGEPKRRSVRFVVAALALGALAVAGAIALLMPKKDDLMATTNQHAVAVAVANARPAPAAFNKPVPAQPEAEAQPRP